MIQDCDIVHIGQFGKSHGIDGEINLLTDVDVENLSCIIVNVDGINVPFFLNSVRSRGTGSYLVIIDGIDSDADVACMVNEQVFALRHEIAGVSGDDGVDDADGFYAEDLVGYDVEDPDAGLSGSIEDIDDATDNVLFIVRTDDGRRVMIPVADEFISDIDVEHRLVRLDIPVGLLEL